MDPFSQLGGPQAPAPLPLMGSTAGLNDIATKLQTANQLMAKLVAILSTLFPRTQGTFTCSAAATTTVSEAVVNSNSFIMLMPTNAAAGTLIGSAKSVYVTPGSASFTVRTANGVAAAGTETFTYVVFNLV